MIGSMFSGTDTPGVSRNQQLRLLGNGVVPQCSQAAYTALLNLDLAVAA